MSIKFEDIGADRLDHGTMKYPTSTVIASSRGITVGVVGSLRPPSPPRPAGSPSN